MSRENVEVVRHFIQAFEAKHGLPSIIDRLWDADGDYYPVRKFPESVPCHGHEEIARFMIEFHETWDRFEWPTRELIAVGEDRVLAITTMRAAGPTSGIRQEGDLFNSVWLRHGRIFRWEDHLTLKGALYALGLHGETLKEAGLEE